MAGNGFRAPAQEMSALQGFLRPRDLRFTVPLWTAITIPDDKCASPMKPITTTTTKSRRRAGRPRPKSALHATHHCGSVGRTTRCRVWREYRLCPISQGGKRGGRRTRQDQISSGRSPGETAGLMKDPHRTKKTRFFYRTGFSGCEAFERDGPAV